jgi:hypothetical protein
LRIVNADTQAGTDLKLFVPSLDLFGFNIQPLTGVTLAVLLQCPLPRDVRGNDNFHSVGESEEAGID